MSTYGCQAQPCRHRAGQYNAETGSFRPMTGFPFHVPAKGGHSSNRCSSSASPLRCRFSTLVTADHGDGHPPGRPIGLQSCHIIMLATDTTLPCTLECLIDGPLPLKRRQCPPHTKCLSRIWGGVVHGGICPDRRGWRQLRLVGDLGLGRISSSILLLK